MANNSKTALARAEASFKKDQRAREAAKAMAEYEAAGIAMREKTARLRALRLRKEAADAEHESTRGTRESRRADRGAPSRSLPGAQAK